MAPFVVAIDGPAASGKGTLARRLAERFGLAHLDTGKLYRATAFLVLEAGADPADPGGGARSGAARRSRPARRPAAARRGGRRRRLGGRRSPGGARRAAGVPARVRGQTRPAPSRGAVLDGRDIGTVVCPDAAVKLFVTASPEARAERRVRELRGRGAAAIYGDVLQDMKERDARDSSRRVAPLAAAPDAETLDTTRLDADQVFEQASEIIARALSADRQPARTDAA